MRMTSKTLKTVRSPANQQGFSLKIDRVYSRTALILLTPAEEDCSLRILK
jgi:hypothetical protein